MALIRLQGSTAGGASVVLHSPVSLLLQSDRFTPADSLNVTVLDSIGNQKITKMTLQVEGEMVFSGIVDVQKSFCTERGRYASFVCRSDACLMLDNEVRPYTYFNLTASQLVEKHALPYGAKGSRFPYNASLSQIIAPKGASQWEFIELFCRLSFHADPFVDRMGYVALTPYNGVSHLFSNRQKNALRYSNAVVTEDRYRIISKLFVKTGKDTIGASYTAEISNPFAAALGIVRERYYNPSREWLEQAGLGGQSLINENQLDCFELELTLPGLRCIRVGDQAEFDDEIGVFSGLYVSQVKLVCDQNGLCTKVKLWEKRFLNR